MSTRFPGIACSALLLLLSVTTAFAAEKDALLIEVLVFAQPGADGAKYWQDTRPLPVCHAVALRDGSGAEAAFNSSADCLRQSGYEAAYGGFSGTSGSALTAQADTLKANGYTLLLSRQWRQAGTNLSPVLLRGGKSGADRQELQGTLNIRTADKTTEAVLEFALTKMNGEKPQYVTLQETRGIETGKIHYFDHPMFGVLLKISVAP